jgi:hypothetical protein
VDTLEAKPQDEMRTGAATPVRQTTRVIIERTSRMELTNFGNAAISFIPEDPGSPPSSTTTGNVTVNTEGVPGRPAYFEATYVIAGHLDSDTVRLGSTLHIRVPVTGAPDDAPYRKVELQAARRIPDALRALADAVEKNLEPNEGHGSENQSD